jgi:monovalent cation:H+ antiporter-2, CPA2 family
VPHNIDLILMLAGGLGAALVLGLVTHRLGLSPIVGYLLAGVVVGPFTPGFVADRHLAEQAAELGVVLLMFGVGLHFHLKDLLAVWRVAVPGALIQSAVATALGIVIVRWFGWSLAAGVVFGLSISVASTVVLVRVLSDHDALHTPSGHVAVGWLVVEDLFTVVALVLLPVLVNPGGDSSLGLALGKAVISIVAVVALAWALGRFVTPRLLTHVARTRSRELFTLTVLVVAIGTAAGAATGFGVSMALGAFLAGMVVGQSEFSSRAASEALPMRDAFAVLFFVSVGMLVDPAELWNNAGLILATVAVVIVGKACAAYAVVRLLRYPVKTAIAVAVALAQIGEFSFMLASLGREAGVLPPIASQVLVAASIVSITLNPLLFRTLPKLFVRASARAPQLEAPELEPPSAAHGAIVVGYGPVGRSVNRLLRDNAVRTTVIELNHDTVRELQASGQPAVYGDASQSTILEHAGVRDVATLIFAASGTPPRGIIETARELNPKLRILARSAYAREVSDALSAGANVVVCGEVEVALAMAEVVLSELGATGENLDRARQRTREDLAPATS